MRVRVWVQLLLILVTAAIAASAHAQEYVRDSEPKLMSYDELVQLSQNQDLSPELTEQLHILTTTPFINNGALGLAFSCSRWFAQTEANERDRESSTLTEALVKVTVE